MLTPHVLRGIEAGSPRSGLRGRPAWLQLGLLDAIDTCYATVKDLLQRQSTEPYRRKRKHLRWESVEASVPPSEAAAPPTSPKRWPRDPQQANRRQKALAPLSSLLNPLTVIHPRSPLPEDGHTVHWRVRWLERALDAYDAFDEAPKGQVLAPYLGDFSGTSAVVFRRFKDHRASNEPVTDAWMRVNPLRLGRAAGLAERLVPYYLRRGVGYFLSAGTTKETRDALMGHHHHGFMYWNFYRSETRHMMAGMSLARRSDAPKSISVDGLNEVMTRPKMCAVVEAYDIALDRAAAKYGTVVDAAKVNCPLYQTYRAHAITQLGTRQSLERHGLEHALDARVSPDCPSTTTYPSSSAWSLRTSGRCDARAATPPWTLAALVIPAEVAPSPSPLLSPSPRPMMSPSHHSAPMDLDSPGRAPSTSQAIAPGDADEDGGRP
ncbi:MAG: hypothetical protein M1826_001786 [Phylliscum demangeonii]|nr:MAG: hypothetical protein M1826_001786 [Phylliscum demangeonii]